MKAMMLLFVAACGSATGNRLPDAEHVSLDGVTVTPPTAMVKRGLDAPTQLTATGMLSDGISADITEAATWTSSDPTIATVSSSGLVTPVGAGMTSISAQYEGQMASSTVHVAEPRIYMADFSTSTTGAPAITIFDAFASGNTAPLGQITGAATTLSFPWSVAVVNDEIYVADEGQGSVSVWPITANGNVAPARQIVGAMTKIAANGSSYAMTVYNGEIYVSTNSEILVFPATATGNVAPTREIIGVDTHISNDLSALAVYKNELYVGDLTNGQVEVFPVNANGDVPPTRLITGLAPYDLAIDHDELFVADLSAVRVFLSSANGPAATTMIRRIAGNDTGLATAIGVNIVGDEIYSVDFAGTGIHVDPRTASGDATATRGIPNGGLTTIGSPRLMAIY